MIIDEIRNAYLTGMDVEYKLHCLKRMFERDVSKKDVENCILNGEIIEDYPLDDTNKSEESFPSCLILGLSITKEEYLHVVLGYNGLKIIIISVYHPDLEHWENDYKTRRNSYV